MPPDKINEEPKISVADFVKNAPAELNVEVLAGENGLRQKQIVSSRIQKLALGLARFSHYIHTGRIQIVGQSETSYLEQLKSEQRIEALNNLDLDKISCVLITRNLNFDRNCRQNSSLTRFRIGCGENIGWKAFGNAEK